MRKPEILAILKTEKNTLASRFGVEELALFGSYARGEETAESDIDILVTLKKPDYGLLMAVMSYLEKRLSKKIDIVRKGPHLSERFFSIVGKDIIYV